MFRHRIDSSCRYLLPEYANGNLNWLQARIVREWLKHSSGGRHELEQIESLQAALRGQPAPAPPPAIYQGLRSQIRSKPIEHQRPARAWPGWILLSALIIIAVALVWQALPPGLELTWSVEGGAPKVFRVYRAPANVDAGETAKFTLLSELQANPGEQVYEYLDLRSLPGQMYVYRIEAVDQAGWPAASKVVVGRGQDALPGQILLIMTGLIACYGLLLMVQQSRISANRFDIAGLS